MVGVVVLVGKWEGRNGEGGEISILGPGAVLDGRVVEFWGVLELAVVVMVASREGRIEMVSFGRDINCAMASREVLFCVPSAQIVKPASISMLW